MHYEPELTVVWILSFTLAVGAALRMLAIRFGLPYTVAMLLVGIGVGGLGRWLGGAHDGPNGLGAIFEQLSQGAMLSPDLIIFVFLPALVFESSFSVKVHTFRQNAGAILLQAIPVLLISTVCIGALMVALTAWTWTWNWIAALVFGALISATDPVAVVALLRELGAPKRLALLIEGESLLNDGTAIVTFTVLSGLLAGTTTFYIGDTVMRFLWVTGGGAGVGLLLAMLASAWLSRTFNAPLVEITITVVLAYAAMLLAESQLHVSGVMAVVTAGLWMSGPGRLQISPEVTHFLHRFWEMLSYFANTLIFFLVGLVISMQIGAAGLTGLFLIGMSFIGVVIVRFGLTYLSLPVMNQMTDPISMTSTACLLTASSACTAAVMAVTRGSR